MFKSLRILAAAALALGAAPGNAAMIVVDLVDATNTPTFFGRVTFTDVAPNQVQITADISSPINAGITQGDILGLWFDFATIAQPAVPSVTLVSGTIFAGSLYSTDSVSNSLGGNVNINGSGPAGWDLGLAVGQNGAPGGFNQMVTLIIAATGLSTNEFAGQRVGMRVQSITGVAGFNAGSSKLLRTVAPPQPVTEPGLLGMMLLSLGLIGAIAQRRRVK